MGKRPEGEKPKGAAKSSKGLGKDDEKKSPPAKKQKLLVPVTGDDGWTLHPPSLIYKRGHVKSAPKIAAFDLDGTLVNTQSGMDMPRNAMDWKLFNGNVSVKIQECVEDGFKVVIFSNQGGIKSALEGKAAANFKSRVEAIVDKLSQPIQVFAATQKDEMRKPATGMWDFMVQDCNDGIEPDLSESFFVGDFAGRPNDKADTDREFAAAVGIKFYTPEEYFGKSGNVPSDGPNAKAIDVLSEMATLLRGKGEAFRANALSKAAAAIQAHPTKLETSKEAQKLAGVGKSSGGVVEELHLTGKCKALEELRAEAGGAGKEKAKEEAKAKAKGAAFKFM